MQLKDTSPQRPLESHWPNCPARADLCLVYQMTNTLGVGVQDIHISFIGDAEDGSRLNCRRT